MAIFYEHIKGCNPNNTAMTWIKWSTERSVNDDNEMFKAKHLPSIRVGEGVQNFWDLGKIITSDAVEQSINQYFSLPAGAYVPNISMSKEAPSNGNISYDDENSTLLIDAKGHNTDGILKGIGKHISFIANNGLYLGCVDGIEIGNSTSFKEDVSVTEGVTAKTLKAHEKCEAQYFNATSDARAKSNITPAQFSALDVIQQLPIYTFNYLNDPKLSVGLIAQEAAEHDLDGFNMVDNLDAAGEFGDFMQVKESKLVYVLWKAVQELTDEVNSLKAQIQQLNNK